MKRLQWTDKKPTDVGWYWRKDKQSEVEPNPQPYIVEVRQYDGSLCVSKYWKITEGYEWAGPIPTPIYPVRPVKKIKASYYACRIAGNKKSRLVKPDTWRLSVKKYIKPSNAFKECFGCTPIYKNGDKIVNLGARKDIAEKKFLKMIKE